MFFNDQVAAFANIGRALRPGGRLAVMAWQELARNEWLMAFREALAVGRTLGSPPNGAPGPFGLADPDHVRRVLGRRPASWTSAVEAIEEPLEFGTDADDAFAFVRTMGIVEGMTHDLDEADTARALDAVHEVLRGPRDRPTASSSAPPPGSSPPAGRRPSGRGRRGAAGVAWLHGSWAKHGASDPFSCPRSGRQPVVVEKRGVWRR